MTLTAPDSTRPLVAPGAPACRHCGTSLDLVFADLGMQPLANRLIRLDQQWLPETFYPLKPLICRGCGLVQLPNLVDRGELFDSYVYFSGQSATWRRHCAKLAHDLRRRFDGDRAWDIASNDGTMVFALCGAGWDASGVEPARNVANYARYQGAEIAVGFYGRGLVAELSAADLIVAQNVLGHVPDLDDFLGGITQQLRSDGVVVFEFPHLARLIEGGEWDTIYHEHHSYLSLWATVQILGDRGLRVFDVEEIPTHGGSLRVYATHASANGRSPDARVVHLLDREREAGLTDPDRLAAFADVPPADRDDALLFLLGQGLGVIAGYGAAAKGMVWLNYLGLDRGSIPLIVDSTPAKQGKLAPGCRIPIERPDTLSELRPDTILILPWNWTTEIEAKIRRDCPWQPRVISRKDWRA